MRITLLREIPDDSSLRAQWNALVLHTQIPQVFYTWEWAIAVQRSYGATFQPLLFLAHDNEGCLCGVAALAVDANEQVSFLCATTGDYCDFVVSEQRAAEFTILVVETLRQSGYRDVVLTNFPQDSPSFMALTSGERKSGFRIYARTAYLCAQVRFEKDLGAGTRLRLPRQRMVQRSLKALGQAGPVAIEHESRWEEVQPLLPELAHAQVSRLLLNGKISNMIRPERRQFLAELAALLSPTGWLSFSRMKTGSRTIAWHYGFRFCRRWSLYQLTFLNELEKHSPGFVLLFKLVEAAEREPAMEAADLGVGTETYKEAFANSTRRTMYVTMHLSLFQHWKEMLRYRIASAIAASPRSEKAVRSLLAKAKALRQRARSLGARETCIWAAKRFRSAIATQDEVIFYELTSPDPALLKSEGVFLNRIDLDTLATAAMQNADDEGTLAYLVRSARRLRVEPDSIGFALTNSAGEFLHFTWAGPFENFYWSELASRLPSPAPGSVVMFDSWTPVSQRGRGHYGPTLSLAVAKIRQEGKRCWGFSASTNTASIRGLEKAGFHPSFSVFRHRFLWWQKIVHRGVAVPSTS